MVLAKKNKFYKLEEQHHGRAIDSIWYELDSRNFETIQTWSYHGLQQSSVSWKLFHAHKKQYWELSASSRITMRSASSRLRSGGYERKTKTCLFVINTSRSSTQSASPLFESHFEQHNQHCALKRDKNDLNVNRRIQTILVVSSRSELWKTFSRKLWETYSMNSWHTSNYGSEISNKIGQHLRTNDTQL